MGWSALSVTVPFSIFEVGLVFFSEGPDDPPRGNVSCAAAQLTKIVVITSANQNFFMGTPGGSYFLADANWVRCSPTFLRSLSVIWTVISGLGCPLGVLISA